MKSIKGKTILGLALALVLAGVGVWAAGNVVAANGDQQTMTDKLSERLGVDKSKVDDAFSQIRQEKQEEMKNRMSSNLDKAIEDGVITVEQKQKILDRQSEMQKQREQQRTEMEQWATDNGIDFDKLRDYGCGMGQGMGMKGMGVRGGHGNLGMLDR